MIRLDRILIPTDFSELAAHALRYGCHLARNYEAEVHVLHVVSPAREVPIASDAGSGMGMGNMVLIESIQEAVGRRTKDLQVHVGELCGDLPRAALPVVRAGAPWEEIVRYADESHCDLVVIGTHARGVMKRILLGSTSKSVLEHVARPVLMVPLAALQDQAEGEEDS